MKKRALKVLFVGSLVGSLLNFGNVVSASEKDFTSFSTYDGNDIKVGKTLEDTSKFNVSKASGVTNEELNVDVKKLDNGIEQTVTTKPNNEKVVYETPFDFKNGEHIELVKDDEGKTDGSALVYDKDGESTAVIMPTLALSESGKELKNVDITTVIKNGDTLQQTVDYNGTSQTVKLVTAAASKSFSDYFSSGSWITRDKVISLSLKPKAILWSNHSQPNANAALNKDSWAKVKSKFSSSSKWKNEGSIKNQYDCHYYVAKGTKTPWNLEPSRPNVGYNKTVLAKCNP